MEKVTKSNESNNSENKYKQEQSVINCYNLFQIDAIL